mmetsp:Transcript_6943/g.10811  ORF Transcript_6943/g.10811 Transcript_6943/m.10811 type:complete len:212 (-) Transcript_6943:298-933(-)
MGCAMLQYTESLHPLRMRVRNWSHACPRSISGPSNSRSRKAKRGVGRMSAHAHRMCTIACAELSLCVSGMPFLGSIRKSLSAACTTSSICGPVHSSPSHGNSGNPWKTVLACAIINGSSASAGPALGTGGPVHFTGLSTACHGPLPCPGSVCVVGAVAAGRSFPSSERRIISFIWAMELRGVLSLPSPLSIDPRPSRRLRFLPGFSGRGDT